MNATPFAEPEIESVESTARQTILLVDDDAAQTQVLSHRLRAQGFETLRAGSGEQALALARSEGPDLVVLKLHLPDLDGFTVCRDLVDSAETCGVPVIVLTEDTHPNIVRQCRAAGCHFFLRTPYDPSVLLVLICEALQHRNAW